MKIGKQEDQRADVEDRDLRDTIFVFRIGASKTEAVRGAFGSDAGYDSHV